MRNKLGFKFVEVVVIALLFVAIGVPTFAGLPVRPDQDFYGTVNFDGPIKIDGTTVNATAAQLNQLNTGTGSMDRISAKTAGSDVTIPTNVTISGWATYSAATLTVTNGQAIVPTAKYMKLLPTGVCTCTVTVVTTGGREVVFEVGNSNSVLFADDNSTQNLVTDRTLTTNRLLRVWSSTGPNKWLEAGYSENQ